MMNRRRKIFGMATVVMAVAVLLCAVIIMWKGAGIVEAYDFGAGAYYYADIPEFEKIISEDAYKTSVPVLLHVGLFLLWGWAMYRLWVKIDGK